MTGRCTFYVESIGCMSPRRNHELIPLIAWEIMAIVCRLRLGHENRGQIRIGRQFET